MVPEHHALAPARVDAERVAAAAAPSAAARRRRRRLHSSATAALSAAAAAGDVSRSYLAPNQVAPNGARPGGSDALSRPRPLARALPGLAGLFGGRSVGAPRARRALPVDLVAQPKPTTRAGRLESVHSGRARATNPSRTIQPVNGGDLTCPAASVSWRRPVRRRSVQHRPSSSTNRGQHGRFADSNPGRQAAAGVCSRNGPGKFSSLLSPLCSRLACHHRASFFWVGDGEAARCCSLNSILPRAGRKE